MVVIVQVQGPCRVVGQEGGSQWVQQQGKMDRLKAQGLKVQSTPAHQLLVDLYRVLEPHVRKGHVVVVGGDFNMRWGSRLVGAQCTDAYTGLEGWAATLQLGQVARERGLGQLPTWSKTEDKGAVVSEPDHVFVSKALLGSVKAVGVYTGRQVNGSDHRPLVLEISLQQALGLGPAGERLEGGGMRKAQKKLQVANGGHCRGFQDKVLEGYATAGLEERLEELELLGQELVGG